MNAKEALLSAAQRERVGKPDKSEVARFINSVLPEPRQAQLDSHSDEGFVLPALSNIKASLEKQNESISRVALSATMVLWGNGRELRSFAERALRENQIPNYRFFSDLYFGLRTAMQTLYVAEREIAGKTDTDITEAVTSVGQLTSIPLSEQVQESLAYTQEVKRNAELLKQDPSGFKLLDDYLADLEEEKFPSLSEEYVVEGARLAVDLYKSVYQISSKLA